MGDRVREKRAEMKDGKLDEMERKPLVHRLLEYRLPSGELMAEKDVVSEHVGHLCVTSLAASWRELLFLALTVSS